MELVIHKKNIETQAFVCRICQCRALPAEYFGDPVDALRCASCGSIQVRILPSTQFLAQFYGQHYLDKYTAGMSPDRFQKEMPLRHAAKLKLISKFTGNTGRLLDVGCGEGFFLSKALKAGFEAVGCDYGLRSNYPHGVNVSIGNLDNHHGLPFEDENFDVVTIFGVIEHICNPHAAIHEIYRVLRKSGWLFCETCVCGDICERLVAARSHWIHPPEHLHIFSIKGLQILLQNNGFKIIKHIHSFERNHFRWFLRKLRNLMAGALMGYIIQTMFPSIWSNWRQMKVTQIGDGQLIIARKN